jgi:hypothetical protein
MSVETSTSAQGGSPVEVKVATRELDLLEIMMKGFRQDDGIKVPDDGTQTDEDGKWTKLEQTSSVHELLENEEYCCHLLSAGCDELNDLMRQANWPPAKRLAWATSRGLHIFGAHEPDKAEPNADAQTADASNSIK